MNTLTPKNKKFRRRAASCALALLMGAGALPMEALAGTYNPGSGQEMSQMWWVANQADDLAPKFYMTDNIDMAGYGALGVMNGASYWIGSQGNKNYTISNVQLTQEDDKGGSVTIDANVSGTDQVLQVSGEDVKVTVNGNVTQTSAKVGDFDAVNVTEAQVQINGSVTSKGIAVMAGDDAQVTVKGDVTSQNYMGVIAGTDSTVTVNGNVTAKDLAVNANSATVNVKGSVTSQEDRGIAAYNGAAVTVDKNVSSDETAILAKDSSVTVNGSVTMKETGTPDPLEFVIRSDDGTVTVNGNVTSAEGGVLSSGGEITVQGNVTTEGQTSLSDGAVMEVGGDFISEKKATKIGKESGVFVKDSELTVEDDFQAPLLNVMDDSEVFIAGDVKAKSVAVGSGDPLDPNDTVDTSTLRTGDIYWDKNKYDTTVHANGKSNTTVYGSVYGAVYASGDSTVNVTGTTGFQKGEDEGFVQSWLSSVWTKDPEVSYNPTTPSADDDLVELCRGYFPGSEMYEHLTSFHTEMSKAMKEISSRTDPDKASGWLNALLISMTQHDDILKDKYLKGIDLGALNLEGYNDASLKAFKATKNINKYQVEMYKANLATALKKIEEESEIQVDKGNIKKIAGLVGDLNEMIAENNFSKLPEELQTFLKTATKDGDLSIGEIEIILTKLDYFGDDSAALAQATQQMADMFDFVDLLDTGAKTVKGIMLGADFAEFWTTNYANQVAVLDNLLTNTEMPPEQFLAMAQLRRDYADKALGMMNKGKNEIVDFLTDKAVSLAYKPLSIAETFIDLGALVTGVDGYTDGLHNGTAMVSMLPNLYNAYEASIKQVRDGDKSDAAIAQVKGNFALLRETLRNLCLAIKEVDKDLAEEYDAMYKSLGYLSPGEILD